MTSPPVLPGITVNLNVSTPLQPGDRVVVAFPAALDEQQLQFYNDLITKLRTSWSDLDFVVIVGGTVTVANGAAGTGVSLGRILM